MGAGGARVNNSGRLIYLDSNSGFCAYGAATAVAAMLRLARIARDLAHPELSRRGSYWGGT
jgi:hypothetical protein